MSITDEEIGALKRQMRDNHRSVGPKTVVALLERLEAAEKAIEADSHTERCVDEFVKNGCTCGFQKAIDAWRKAAGK